MSDLLTTGGAGGLGALLGTLFTFFGIKSKIGDVDKRIDKLTGTVMYTDTCEVKHAGLNQRLDSADKMQTEIRDDVKGILKELRKR